MIWFVIILGSFLALFALLSLALWIWTTILYFVQASRHTLMARSVSLQFPFAFSVTGSLLFALAFTYPAFIFDPMFSHSWISSLVLTSSLTAIGIIILLWLCIPLLYLLPAIPEYRYFLPRDAELVRRLECQLGIALAARKYPDSVSLDQDSLELIALSTSILWRQEHYPKKKRHAIQLTNEFATYTKLSIEGFSCGYRSFCKAYQDAPDTLKAQRKAIEEGWPDEASVYKMVEELASAYLTPSNPQSSP